MLLNRQLFRPIMPVSSCGLRLLFLISILLPGFKIHASESPANQLIGKIELLGNSVTRPYIIYRELVFSQGDTIPAGRLVSLIVESRQNLLNTGLFNFVTIDTLPGNNDRTTDIRISVIERWFIWPSAILQITDRNINSWWASRDFTRINYGFKTIWSNFRGRMEVLDLMLRFGKNPEYSLYYDAPYLDKRKVFGAGFELGFIRNREVGYKVQADKLVFLFDRRYTEEQRYAFLHFSFRPKIHTTQLAELRLQAVSVADTLATANPGFLYPGFNRLKFMSLYYKLKIDFRDTRYYPLSGWYADLEIYRAGLGGAFEKPVNYFWIKSTSRLFIPLSSRWYFGAGFIGKAATSGSQPFFLRQMLGFDRDYVRGYEYYVIDGQYYAVSKVTLKYALIPQFITHIELIPSPKFNLIHFASYLTFYVDAGYAWKNRETDAGLNKLPGSLMLGSGVGLDLVTYYDKMIRLEYSVNKMGESGIFIHLIAGI